MTACLDARPPLSARAAAVLRRQAGSLADDFGRDGWQVFLSDAPAGWLYATWNDEPGVTQHAPTALELREKIAARMAEWRDRARREADRALAGWAR